MGNSAKASLAALVLIVMVTALVVSQLGRPRDSRPDAQFSIQTLAPGMPVNRLPERVSHVSAPMLPNGSNYLHFGSRDGVVTDLTYRNQRILAVRGTELERDGQLVASVESTMLALHDLLGEPNARFRDGELYQYPKGVVFLQLASKQGQLRCKSLVVARSTMDVQDILDSLKRP